MTKSAPPFVRFADVRAQPAEAKPAVLRGWKQIASHLHRDMRTVQRWERLEQLPVHRQLHRKLGTVHALQTELDEWLAQRSSAPKSGKVRSIAVRYLTNLGDRGRGDHLCSGIVEDLITGFSKLEGVRVYSRSAMARFRGSASDAVSVGRALKASHVVEGSLRCTGSRLCVHVQLVDTRTGYAIWAERFDRTVKELFTIQAGIARGVAGALGLDSAPQKQSGMRLPTDNVQAYDLYLRGRQHFHQFRRSSFQRARMMFARARTADPGFALAHAGFADCCSYLYLYWDPTRTNLAAADAASRKAVALNPELAEAHTSRAMALSTLRNYPDAEEEFRRATKLDPGLFEAHYFYGRACLAQGKFQEAIQPLRTACRVCPEDYQAPCFLAMAYAGLGRRAAAARTYAVALKVLKQELSVNPGDVRALYLGAVVLARIGRRKTALAWAARALDLDGRDSAVLYNVGCLYAVLGRTRGCSEVPAQGRAIRLAQRVDQK